MPSSAIWFAPRLCCERRRDRCIVAEAEIALVSRAFVRARQGAPYGAGGARAARRPDEAATRSISRLGVFC